MHKSFLIYTPRTNSLFMSGRSGHRQFVRPTPASIGRIAKLTNNSEKYYCGLSYYKSNGELDIHIWREKPDR